MRFRELNLLGCFEIQPNAIFMASSVELSGEQASMRRCAPASINATGLSNPSRVLGRGAYSASGLSGFGRATAALRLGNAIMAYAA